MIFPRQGEQCLIEKFSYKGYSPPKCTCNAINLTFINTLSKTYAFLRECSHVMPKSQTLTDSLTHAHVMYEKPSFPKQKIFVLYFNSLDSLRKTVLFKSHVSFVGNKLSRVSPQASYTFQNFCRLSPLDAYV